MQPEEPNRVPENETENLITPSNVVVPTEETEDTPVISPDSQPTPESFQPQEPNNTAVTTSAPELPVNGTPQNTVAPVQATQEPAVSQDTPAAPDNDGTVVPAASAVPAAVASGALASGQAGGGKGKKKKLVLFAGIVIAVLMLAAGAAGAYFGYVLPNQPQKITQDAISNSIDSKKLSTAQFEGEVGISGGDAGKVVSSVTFEGGAESAKEAFDIKVTANTAVTKINLDARSTDGKSFYLRLSGLNGLDSLISQYAGVPAGSAEVAQYAALLKQINDQWFVIDESLLSQIPGAESVGTGEKLSSEDAKRIGEIYNKNQFLNIDKRLADQDIHGVDSYHVQATINKDKLKSFMQEIKNANIKNLTLKQSDIDSINDVDFSKYPFDIWVGKKDRVLTQFATTVQESGTTYKFRIALKDFNKPVTVEQPANAKSVLELLSELSPALSGGAESPTLMGL